VKKTAPKYPHDSPPLYRADKGDWERCRYRLLIHVELRDFLGSVAHFADQWGESIHPGVDILAAINHVSGSTVKRYLDFFRTEVPLLELMSRGGGRPPTGGRRQLASEYRLVIPDDLWDRIPMLSPDYETPAGADLTQLTGRLVMSRVKPRNSAHIVRVGELSSSAEDQKLSSRNLETQLTNAHNSAHEPVGNGRHQSSPDKLSTPANIPSFPHRTSARECEHGNSAGFLGSGRTEILACGDCRRAQNPAVEAS